MKKSIALISVVLAMLLIVTGCSKDSNDSSSSATAKTVDGSKVSITLLNSKGEIQTGLEKIAAQFEKDKGIHVEVIACGAGEVPYTKITTMYNSGNAPTLAILDPTDIVGLAKEYALELTDQAWTAETEALNLTIDGKIYSFPFCVEGRGIIYNKEAIESTLGREFDPKSINSYSSFKAILEELRKKGMENPVFIAKEDWSLGAHQLGFIYDAYDGTTAGSEVIINELKAGKDPLTVDRFNQFVATMDLMLEYNFAKADPLGADYDQGALELACGNVAFWPNGCWAWPNLVEGGADVNGEFGFISFVLGDDTSDFANNMIQASASKQIMVDKVQSTAEQQAAAKEFINYLVYDANGQKMFVEETALIPAAKNNPNAPLDPLGKDIAERTAAGLLYTSCFIAPSDHWSVMGAAMQKYISRNSSKADLASALSQYWKAQN